MEKPSKPLLIAYITWCAIHILIGIATLLQGGWYVDGDIWPFASTTLYAYYDIVEIIIYCGLPLIIWYIYSKIVQAYY